jgi:hypothetical protein
VGASTLVVQLDAILHRIEIRPMQNGAALDNKGETDASG